MLIKKLVTMVKRLFGKKPVADVETMENERTETVEVEVREPNIESAYFKRVSRFAEEFVNTKPKHEVKEPPLIEEKVKPKPSITWEQFKSYNQQVNKYLNNRLTVTTLKSN